MNSEETTVIKTDVGAKDGQSKCPKCGATDISLNMSNGKLRCNFCRHEFEAQKVSELDVDLNNLTGKVIGSGASNISADASDLITLKCSSCGAEVVLDTISATQAKCHWCRNILSINQQIPNGSIPDLLLPFKVKKEDAQKQIKEFVDKRKFFANPQFSKEFTTENIMGVYLPYMLVSANAHSEYKGSGEHTLRRYTVGIENNKKTLYDAQEYQVERGFDLTISDLSVESSTDKLSTTSANTNNVINAILPFDTENCVRFDSNYMRGFSSEKRDTNIEQLDNLVKEQLKDVSRNAANDSLSFYDRGVRWDAEKVDIKGEQWKSAYLPVWLYSYLEEDNNKKTLHYVAVNARTLETMGSVPLHVPKLIVTSIIIEIFCIILAMTLDFDGSWIFLLGGVIFYFLMMSRYRNSNARHTYEKETKTNLTNLRKIDNFLTTHKGLSNAVMTGANNNRVNGTFSNANNLLNNEGNKNSSFTANLDQDSAELVNFVKKTLNIPENGNNQNTNNEQK